MNQLQSLAEARTRVYDAMDNAGGPVGIADGCTSLADLRIAEAAALGADVNRLDPATGRHIPEAARP